MNEIIAENAEFLLVRKSGKKDLRVQGMQREILGSTI